MDGTTGGGWGLRTSIRVFLMRPYPFPVDRLRPHSESCNERSTEI